MIRLHNLSSFYKHSKEQIISNLQYVKFPERFKGTIVEKWKDYWVNLIKDYSDVVKDTASAAKAHPYKAATIFSVFGFGIYCMKTNPDESSYRDAVLSYSSDIILVGPTVRNPAAKKYLEEIETYYNQGLLNKLSLGLFSVMWKQNYGNQVAIYKSQCPYLKIPFYKYYEQIVDIGFINKWYILEKKMIDFDINPEEWNTEVTS